jgi:hypothetical protein
MRQRKDELGIGIVGFVDQGLLGHFQRSLRTSQRPRTNTEFTQGELPGRGVSRLGDIAPQKISIDSTQWQPGGQVL